MINLLFFLQNLLTGHLHIPSPDALGIARGILLIGLGIVTILMVLTGKSI